ncbi:hypothetical protein Scep_004161 [Stephania cephalantha]|uniref:Uncharacterized protein n=1 Tax=Stephania cephalantha TaxID=152367 RepID=A0AAP0KRX3_9MAGN
MLAKESSSPWEGHLNSVTSTKTQTAIVPFPWKPCVLKDVDGLPIPNSPPTILN